MRAALLIALLAASLAGCGLDGVAHGATTGPVVRRDSNATTTHPTRPRNNSTRLSRDELFAAVDEDVNHSSATSYYVSENGTWYHVSTNGTVGTEAPDGDVIPNVVHGGGTTAEHDRFDLRETALPVFVWKVRTADGCDTLLYDATDGETVASVVPPSCPPPTPPQLGGNATAAHSVTSARAETSPPASPSPSPATSTGGQPGFDASVAILGLLGAA